MSPRGQHIDERPLPKRARKESQLCDALLPATVAVGLPKSPNAKLREEDLASVRTELTDGPEEPEETNLQALSGSVDARSLRKEDCVDRRDMREKRRQERAKRREKRRSRHSVVVDADDDFFSGFWEELGVKDVSSRPVVPEVVQNAEDHSSASNFEDGDATLAMRKTVPSAEGRSRATDADSSSTFVARRVAPSEDDHSSAMNHEECSSTPVTQAVEPTVEGRSPTANADGLSTHVVGKVTPNEEDHSSATNLDDSSSTSVIPEEAPSAQDHRSATDLEGSSAIVIPKEMPSAEDHIPAMNCHGIGSTPDVGTTVSSREDRSAAAEIDCCSARQHPEVAGCELPSPRRNSVCFDAPLSPTRLFADESQQPTSPAHSKDSLLEPRAATLPPFVRRSSRSELLSAICLRDVRRPEAAVISASEGCSIPSASASILQEESSVVSQRLEQKPIIPPHAPLADVQEGKLGALLQDAPKVDGSHSLSRSAPTSEAAPAMHDGQQAMLVQEGAGFAQGQDACSLATFPAQIDQDSCTSKLMMPVPPLVPLLPAPLPPPPPLRRPCPNEPVLPKRLFWLPPPVAAPLPQASGELDSSRQTSNEPSGSAPVPKANFAEAMPPPQAREKKSSKRCQGEVSAPMILPKAALARFAYSQRPSCFPLASGQHGWVHR